MTNSSIARSRSRLRERPLGRERERASGRHPTSTARRPARSERPAHSPFAATQPRPSRSASPRSAGPERVKRWRRGHIHFSPERARAVRRAPARPEWSVASDAEGGTRRAVRAGTYTPANRWRALTQQQNRGGTERGRPLVVPRRRKHRRDEARSESRPASGRGLSR